MGRLSWGKSAGAVLLVVGVTAMSGCSSGETDAKASVAKPKTVTIQGAALMFQDAVAAYDATGCESREPGTCWEQMLAVIEPARALRKAMNADTSVGADFYSGAYALIDKMEKGIAVGEDRGGFDHGNGDDPGAILPPSNRPAVFGSAHDLGDWLDEHPAK